VEFRGNSKLVHVSFRHGNEYLVAEDENLLAEYDVSYKKQFQQESRRLMYVAVTRARYKCFLHHSKGGRNSSPDSVIGKFISELRRLNSEAYNEKISIYEPSEEENNKLKYPSNDSFPSFRQGTQAPTVRTYRGDPLQENWRKLSYSAIATHAVHKREAAEPVKHEDAFDRFVFDEFPKGAKAGNILHTILEKIDFTDRAGWDSVIGEALDFYRLGGDRNHVKTQLLTWLDHLLQVSIPVGDEILQLSAVGREDLICEFEFDFNLREFSVSQILDVAGEVKMKVNIGFGSVRGIMNGKMDLFFRHNGKYYILDWKSNYLGNTVAHYGADAVATAMEESNYHLQYLLYSLAARLFLRSRIPDFDYETQFGGIIYLFARGVRQVEVTGIFTDKVGTVVLDRLETLLLAAPSA
jgi:exodeoxyribonuclease V beta subunit